MPVDARPTIAAPDDDPYLWLEEIDGERAVAWVDQQNGLTLAKFGTRRICRGSRHARRHPRPAGQHPLRHAARALSLQFLEGRHEPARPVAPNHARQLPHRAAGLGDPPRRRRAGDGRERGLGLARRLDPAGLARSGHPVAVARRQRRRRAARVRHRRQGVRERRLPSARGQGRRRLARPRHAAAVQRLRRGHGHQVRLLREPCGCGGAAPTSIRRRCCSRRRPRAWGCGRRSTAREDQETVWFVDKPGFFDTVLWLGDRSGPEDQARPADRHRARSPSRLAGGEAPHALDDRRQDLRRPTRCSASRCRPSSPASAISRCCSSRPSGAPCSISSGATDS